MESYEYGKCPRCGRLKMFYRIRSKCGYEERLFECGDRVVVEVINPLTSGVIYEVDDWFEAVVRSRINVKYFDEVIWGCALS